VVALLAPFHASRSGTVGLRSPRPSVDSRLNLLSGVAAEFALGYGFGSPGIAVRRKLGLRSRAAQRLGRDYRRALRTTPTILGVSPLVVPTPRDWPSWLTTTGYWSLPASSDWVPQQRLVEFMAQGEQPVYVGFGSMSTRDSAATLASILEALRLSGRRGVIHSGGADLADAQTRDARDSRMLVVDDVPHDWLFPQVAAVVHHGGAGTTAAALRAGVPAGVVSHIGDQPYWGRRIHELGVGATPIPRHHFGAARLDQMLAELAAPCLAVKAAQLGEQLRAERGIERAVAFIERWL
jgi:sterol 3beta-glucosyltransferase